MKISKSLKETDFLAQEFLKKIEDENKNKALVIALFGELGAGKTSFTQSLGEALGIESKITSPTFVVRNSYKTKHSKFKKLIHYDAYRIESSKELEIIGWEKDVLDSQNIICLEWPERISELVPQDAFKVSFEYGESLNERIINFQYDGK